jgi:hypothetical protein
MRYNLTMLATMLFYTGGGFAIYYLDRLSRTKMGVMRYLYGMKEVYSKEIFTQNLLNNITTGLFVLIALSAIILLQKVITRKGVGIYSPLLLLIISTGTVFFILNPVFKEWMVYYCGLIYLLIGALIQTLWFIAYFFLENLHRGNPSAQN